MGSSCSHLNLIHVLQPSARICAECVARGDQWLHLWMCLTCGHVGCCDGSKNRHATQHYFLTDHPVIRSLEPGDTWGWCYIDHELFEMSEVKPTVEIPAPLF